MKTFIRSYSLESMRKKLGITYLFMILDITLTLFLLNAGWAFEANPLMKGVVTSSARSFLVKVLLPAILLLYLGIRMKSADDRQLKMSNFFINSLNFFYLLVVISQVLYCMIFLVLQLFI